MKEYKYVISVGPAAKFNFSKKASEGLKVLL